MWEQKEIYIKVNAEWNKAILELLDIALKAGWLDSLNGAVGIIQRIDIDDEFFNKKTEEVQKEARAKIKEENMKWKK